MDSPLTKNEFHRFVMHFGKVMGNIEKYRSVYSNSYSIEDN